MAHYLATLGRRLFPRTQGSEAIIALSAVAAGTIGSVATVVTVVMLILERR